MVVLVDGAAYGTKTVVAVGQSIGHREFLHAGGPGLLDDTNVGDVVRNQGVELDLKPLRVAGDAVTLKDGPSHGPLAPLGGGDAVDTVLKGAACQEHALIMQSDHGETSCILRKIRDCSVSI